MSWYIYPNRVVCSVLEEMRKSLENLSIFNMYRYKAHMSMLIEEAQTLVNRMEAGLEDKNDLRRLREKTKELKAEYAELTKQVEELKDALGSEDSGDSNELLEALSD